MYYLITFLIALFGYFMVGISKSVGAEHAAFISGMILILGVTGFLLGVFYRLIIFLNEEFPKFMRWLTVIAILALCILMIADAFTDNNFVKIWAGVGK